MKYPDATPVDEPTSKVKPTPKPKPPKPMPDKPIYTDSVPVDEPVVKKAKGGSIRGGGIESRGKTKGKMIAMCGGGMAKGKK